MDLPKPKPVKDYHCTGRGKTMLERGRNIRTSDVAGELPIAAATYNHRYWSRPEEPFHSTLIDQTKTILPANYGTGLAKHLGGLPKNISTKQHGKRAGQRTNRCAAADKRGLMQATAAAHDTMLSPLGPSLSGMYSVLRSFVQRLHQLQFSEFRKTPPKNFDPLFRTAAVPKGSLMSHLRTAGSKMGIAQYLLANEQNSGPLATSISHWR